MEIQEPKKKKTKETVFLRAKDSSGKYAGTVFFVYLYFMLLWICTQPHVRSKLYTFYYTTTIRQL